MHAVFPKNVEPESCCVPYLTINYLALKFLSTKSECLECDSAQVYTIGFNKAHLGTSESLHKGFNPKWIMKVKLYTERNLFGTNHFQSKNYCQQACWYAYMGQGLYVCQHYQLEICAQHFSGQLNLQN